MLSTLEKLALCLAFLGTAISGYLVYTHLSGTQIVCGLSTCGIVNGSEYAKFLGLPVSYWGLAFYLTNILLIWLRQKKLFLLATIAGLIFSIYLTSLEAFVIHAWCQWCLLSAWISLSLFIIAIRLFQESKKSVAPTAATSVSEN